MRLLAATALVIWASLTVASIAVDTRSIGREQSQAFLRGDIEAVWEDMTSSMRQAIGSEEKLRAFRASLERDFGTEVDVTSEEIKPGGEGLELYLRTSKWFEIDAPILMQWAFDANHKVAGFVVRPAEVLADSRFLDYKTKASLRLPFDGEWYVVWGGRTLEQNYHAVDGAQRFALDMLIYRDGTTHSGDPSKLENYYCWDQAVLSPAAGTIVAVTNDLPDNAIGATDPEHPTGNNVVIDLGNSEFAFLAHMRQGSINVSAGDTVEAGQELGKCGNSGNTSEPHLHLHLQNTPDLSSGEGLPAQFVDYLADGAPVARGEPQAGQVISGSQIE